MPNPNRYGEIHGSSSLPFLSNVSELLSPPGSLPRSGKVYFVTRLRAIYRSGDTPEGCKTQNRSCVLAEQFGVSACPAVRRSHFTSTTDCNIASSDTQKQQIFSRSGFCGWNSEKTLPPRPDPSWEAHVMQRFQPCQGCLRFELHLQSPNLYSRILEYLPSLQSLLQRHPYSYLMCLIVLIA